MASVTILSDNGATSGSAGLKTSGGNDGVLLLQTTTSGGTPTTAISISNTQVVTYTNQPTYTGGTANGVLYLNGSKAVTSGTALVFDGSSLFVGAASISGTSSDNKIVGIYGAGSSNRAQLRLTNSNTGTTGSDGFALSVDSSTSVYLTQYENASIVFETNGANERARIDASGNFGVGVVPSSWGGSAGSGVLQIKNGGALFSNTSNNLYLNQNLYFDGTNNKYIGNGYANQFGIVSGAFAWYNSTSGTAGGTVSLTQAMTLDTSGRLLIGATSSQAIGGSVQTNLQLHGTGFDAGTTGLNATSWYTGAGYGGNLFLGHVRSGTVGSQTATVVGTELGNIIFGGSTGSVSSVGANIVCWSSDSTWTGSSTPAYLSFYTVPSGSTSGLERMRLNSSGQVLLPYQPAFMATDQANTFTPASGAYVYAAVKLNRGNHYNSSTGRFTAPVGGVYYFVHQISARPTSSSVIEAKIYVNGSEYSRTFISGAGNVPNGIAALTISLSANDYVQAAFYNGNSPQVVLSGSDDITTSSNGIVSGWMGWLLG